MRSRLASNLTPSHVDYLIAMNLNPAVEKALVGRAAPSAPIDGKVTNYRITSPEPREVKVRVNGELKTIKSEGI
jgi:hypothetical protein